MPYSRYMQSGVGLLYIYTTTITVLVLIIFDLLRNTPDVFNTNKVFHSF